MSTYPEIKQDRYAALIKERKVQKANLAEAIQAWNLEANKASITLTVNPDLIEANKFTPPCDIVKTALAGNKATGAILKQAGVEIKSLLNPDGKAVTVDPTHVLVKFPPASGLDTVERFLKAIGQTDRNTLKLPQRRVSNTACTL